jgi:hypothetical protein
MMPFLNGQCFDFALALAEQVRNPVFVAIGNPDFPEHVALRIGDKYADVRGLLDEESFLAHMKGMPITEIDRGTIERHCGVFGLKPPYKGIREIATARKAVNMALREAMLLQWEPPMPADPIIALDREDLFQTTNDLEGPSP